MMNSSTMIETIGKARICTTAAWLRPSSAVMISSKAMVSGMPATEVTR